MHLAMTYFRSKVHCHNHIIFCAVDFAEHKKYIFNRKSYAQIRRVSDRLCRENGLSVVAPGAERGKQYAEWDAQRKGTNYKQKLKIAIDRLIPISKDLDDLLRRLEAEGYEIKRGKYTSFRAPGQERFARTMVFLDQHGIFHYTDLEQKITELQDSNEQTAATLKTAEHRQHPVPQPWAGTGQSLVASLTFTHYFQVI